MPEQMQEPAASHATLDVDSERAALSLRLENLDLKYAELTQLLSRLDAEVHQLKGKEQSVSASTTVLISPEQHASSGVAQPSESLKIGVTPAAALECTREFADTLEATPNVAVQWLNDTGRVEYWNPASTVLYGYRSDEACGKTLEELNIKADALASFRNTQRAIAATGKAVGPYQQIVRRRDGSELWVLESSFAINKSDGGRVLVCMSVDITEQKRTETSLRRQEETFRALAESSCDIIMRFDAERRILYANPAAAVETGFTKEWLIDKTLEEVGLPNDLCNTWDDAISDVFRRGEVTRVEFALPNGHWFDGLLMPEFDEQRCPRAVITTARDVTFRKRTDEERTKLTEQLQHAMKMEAVGRLAGGVAHDFNNLLTAIKGSISLALLDLDPTCAIVDVLGEANKAADSAATLTRRLLAFSRKQPIEPQTINLNELIYHIKQMLVRLIREDIELVTRFADDVGSVYADQGQVEQILLNLVVNARDAMPSGGRILLETCNVELDEEYQRVHPHTPVGRFVCLAVTDTGCGMSSEVKEHIFEPFFTTKAQGCGTGLGLATIYGAVRQAGGSIEVYSEVGVGTTFKIYLPRTDAVPARVTGMPSWGVMPGGNETVLLVEDDEVLRELTSKFLGRLGYVVLTAPDGLAGLEVARSYEGNIDLLLTDLVLPGMNGRELSYRVAELRPDTKVLYTSGYTDDMVIRDEDPVRSFHFIGKPFALRAMASKLREVLG